MGNSGGRQWGLFHVRRHHSNPPDDKGHYSPDGDSRDPSFLHCSKDIVYLFSLVRDVSVSVYLSTCACTEVKPRGVVARSTAEGRCALTPAGPDPGAAGHLRGSGPAPRLQTAWFLTISPTPDRGASGVGKMVKSYIGLPYCRGIQDNRCAAISPLTTKLSQMYSAVYLPTESPGLLFKW